MKASRTGKQLDRRTIKGKLEATEQHLRNGKELVMRITRKMKAYEDLLLAYETRIKIAGVYIGVMAENAGLTSISKEQITEFLNCKHVQMEESEDKKQINIIVTEVAKDESIH